MKRELIRLNEISRKKAETYAQYLSDGDAVAWLYILAGQYSEFTYREKEYPNAVVSAKDGYYQVSNPNSLVRALMKFSIEGEYGLVYPGELVDEKGEPFDATLDEVRFDEHGNTRYQVDPEGNPELAGFSLANFSLEMVSQDEQQKGHSKQGPGLADKDFWKGIIHDNCNIGISTYLQKCAAEKMEPSPEMCWERLKEDATDYGQNWMIFPLVRYSNKHTNPISRESFNKRYARILERHRRLN